MAERLGHEAALFVPSGTMGNQICLRLAAPPGTEAWPTRTTTSSGTRPRPPRCSAASSSTRCPARGGCWSRPARARVRAARYGVPTSAIAVEQTHNRAGGAVQPSRSWRACAPWPTRPGCTCTATGPGSGTPRSPPGSPGALRGAVRQPLGLLLQGPGRARRVGRGRPPRPGRPGPRGPPPVRRGHAPGRGAGRRRPGRPRADGRPPGRRPRQRPRPGRDGGRGRARQRRPRPPSRPTWSCWPPAPSAPTGPAWSSGWPAWGLAADTDPDRVRLVFSYEVTADDAERAAKAVVAAAG